MEPPARAPQRNSIAANQWDLSTQLLQLREQLRNEETYAAGPEILLRQRNKRIDQLTAQVDQLREHSRHADEKAEHMAMFVGLTSMMLLPPSSLWRVL